MNFSIFKFKTLNNRRNILNIIKSIFVILAIISMNSACQKEPRAQAPQALPVTVTSPNYEEIQLTKTFPGRFKATDKVQLRSRVNGYLDSIHFNDGDYVKKGQLLYIIDQRPFLIALNNAKARLTEIQATQNLENSNLDRAAKLYKAGAISKQNYETRQQQSNSSNATVSAVLADIEAAKLQLSFTKIRAPIAGRISRAEVTTGNLIEENKTILTTIVSEDPIHFYFEVGENDLLTLKRNNILAGKAEAKLKLSDEKFFKHSSFINFIDNNLNTSSGTTRLRATYNNPDSLFKDGMFAEIQIPISKLDYKFIIPSKLISFDQNREFLNVIDEESKVKRVYIDTYANYQNEYRVVDGELPQDLQIITSKLAMLQPGMPVQIGK
jgi:RND family efflux transporter MFP subunit